MGRALPLPEADMTRLVDTCASELRRWFELQMEQAYWPGEENEPMLVPGLLPLLSISADAESRARRVEERRRRRWYESTHALTTARVTGTVGPKRQQPFFVPILFQLEQAPTHVPALVRAYTGTTTWWRTGAAWKRRRPLVTLVLNGSLSVRAIAAYFTERPRFVYAPLGRVQRAEGRPELLSEGYNRLESMLRHEVTHLLDPELYPRGWGYRRDGELPIQQAVAMASPPVEALPAYLNLPCEVMAFTRNIVDEVGRTLDLQETGARALKVQLQPPQERIFTSLLPLSETWRFIEPYLTPTSRQRVLKIVHRALEEIPMQPQPTEPPAFDPDLPLSSETNRTAARARGLRFDAKRAAYVDADGCPRRDRFGQPL